MNTKEMSLEALKALAYDQLAIIGQSQRNLDRLNEEIAARTKAEEKNSTE